MLNAEHKLQVYGLGVGGANSPMAVVSSIAGSVLNQDSKNNLRIDSATK